MCIRDRYMSIEEAVQVLTHKLGGQPKYNKVQRVISELRLNVLAQWSERREKEEHGVRTKEKASNTQSCMTQGEEVSV